MSTKFLKRKKEAKVNERDDGQEQQNDLPNGKEANKRSKRKRRTARRHAFPIWLRILVVIALAILCLIIGVIIGYGVIGDGSPSDALKKQTWQHIIDIVTKE